MQKAILKRIIIGLLFISLVLSEAVPTYSAKEDAKVEITQIASGKDLNDDLKTLQKGTPEDFAATLDMTGAFSRMVTANASYSAAGAAWDTLFADAAMKEADTQIICGEDYMAASACAKVGFEISADGEITSITREAAPVATDPTDAAPTETASIETAPVKEASSELKYARNSVSSAATLDNLCFTINGATYDNGSQIDYAKTATDTPAIVLTKKAGTEVVSGSSYSWMCDDTNVISIKEVVSDGLSGVRLNILSPGYAGLYCYVKDSAGNVYANPYCVIHVALSWETDVNTYDVKSSSNTAKYGLGNAFSTDNEAYTLQLYSKDSTQSQYSHYLRRLSGITYSSVNGDIVKANIERSNLKDISMAIEWVVSNSDVLDVDPQNGYITAKSAGFATITARTTTKNLNTTKSDEISMDVIVTPEAIVVGATTEYQRKFTANVSASGNEIIVQTNAVYANSLSWKLFRDYTMKTDLTKEFKSNMEISDATGRVVLTGLPAGNYYLTAIPVRDEKKTYDIKNNTFVNSLLITLVVPFTFPDSPIVMNYYSSSISDYYDIYENSNLPEGKFTFSAVGYEDVITVGADGVIEAEGKGEGQVRITTKAGTMKEVFGDFTASGAAMGFVTKNGKTYTTNGLEVDLSADGSSATIIIDVVVINGISISANNITLGMGATYQLRLTAPTPYDGVITWTSTDPKIATVDENGLVTAVAAGTARVNATIKINGVKKRARCTVKVVSAVNKIVLKAKQDYVAVGENLTITAEISPKLDGAELTWNVSDEGLASIADKAPLSMTITGVKTGVVVITAISAENAIVGSIVINVIDDITGITLSDKDVTIALSQGYYQLYATVKPALPDSQTLRWSSSDTKVITVTDSGKVELKKPGKAVITVVTQNGLIAQCNFTVTQGVSGINLDKTAITIAVGESYRMTYTIKPETASKTNLKWTCSNTKIATVDATGYITGKNIGECVITAQATDGTGVFVMCTVTVTQAATSIKIDVTSLILNVGETYKLEVTLTPANCTDSLTFEASDSKVVQVSKNGKITGKSKGNSIVLVKTSAGLTAYCNVTVVQQVTGIKISSREATIKVGEKLELEAELSPKTASDKEVEWISDNTRVATVKDDGVVTGVTPGTTLIKCISIDGDYMDYCVLTVVELVSDIIFDPDYVEVGVGKKLTLNVLVSGEAASNKTLDWSSKNKKICTVDKKGVITGVKVGKTIVYAKATDGSGAVGECEVRVITATEMLETEPSFMQLVEGEKGKITYTIAPKKATYTVPDFVSDDESIAVVDRKGNVTGLKAGNCIITATAKDNPSLTSKTVVKVIAPVNATSVTFAESEVIMVPGETKTVPYSIVPSNFTESYTWSSDNPVVATVNENNGRITAKAVGAATITLMTKSGKRGTVRVYVVGLSRSNVTLHQYESLKIKLEIDGKGSENLTIRWDTDNQTIAEISNGKVTGKALGTTKVYAIVNGRQLVCNVKVTKNLNR